MNLEDLRQKGDRFALWFILVFLWVHLGIILPSQQLPPPSEINVRIEAAQDSIDLVRQDLQNQLAQEAAGSVEQGQPIPGTVARESAGLRSPDTAEKKAVSEKTVSPPDGEKSARSATTSDLHQQLLNLDLQYIELEKQKEKRAARSYSIPPFNVSIDEDLIVLLYPAFSLLGLIGLLNYRADYLRALAGKPASNPPAWALPLPWRLYSEKGRFQEWVFLNMAGLAGHFFVIYSIIQFIFSVQRSVAAAINVVFVLLVVVYYLRAISFSLRLERSEPEQERP